MRLLNSFIVIFGLLLLPIQVQAYIQSVSFFDIIEIRFSSVSNTWEDIEKINPRENTENTENTDIILESLVPEPTIEILKVFEQNQKIYLYISWEDTSLWSFQLYINGFLINAKLDRETRLWDAGKTVYSIETVRIQNAIRKGDNEVYFKHNILGKNSQKSHLYYWELVQYHRLFEQIRCDGNIDVITLSDAYNNTIYSKYNYKYDRLNLVDLGNSRGLRDGWYEYQIHCSDEIRDLYYIYNISFEYQAYIDRINREVWHGRYVTKQQYINSLK